MIKIGQIGLGHAHGKAKMNTVRKFPQLFEVVGYAEENESWIEKLSNAKAYEGLTRYSVDELIEKCDALLIETDVWDLTKTAQKCIDAGKHIHLDKPASGTLAEYKHLLDIAKAKNLVVQLGYMYRYNPSIRKAFEMIKAGRLGTIHSILAEMSTCHADQYRQWLNHFPGGNMYIFGCHLIDLIILLLGKPHKVSATIASSNLNNISSPDITSATLQFPNALARVFVSSVECNGWGRRCFSVAGSEGTIEIRPLEVPAKMTFAKKGDGKEYFEDYAKPVETESLPDAQRYDEMMQDFHAFILGQKQNPFTYEHEYAVQEVLDEIVGGVKYFETE